MSGKWGVSGYLLWGLFAVLSTGAAAKGDNVEEYLRGIGLPKSVAEAPRELQLPDEWIKGLDMAWAEGTRRGEKEQALCMRYGADSNIKQTRQEMSDKIQSLMKSFAKLEPGSPAQSAVKSEMQALQREYARLANASESGNHYQTSLAPHSESGYMAKPCGEVGVIAEAHTHPTHGRYDAKIFFRTPSGGDVLYQIGNVEIPASIVRAEGGISLMLRTQDRLRYFVDSRHAFSIDDVRIDMALLSYLSNARCEINALADYIEKDAQVLAAIQECNDRDRASTLAGFGIAYYVGGTDGKLKKVEPTRTWSELFDRPFPIALTQMALFMEDQVPAEATLEASSLRLPEKWHRPKVQNLAYKLFGISLEPAELVLAKRMLFGGYKTPGVMLYPYITHIWVAEKLDQVHYYTRKRDIEWRSSNHPEIGHETFLYAAPYRVKMFDSDNVTIAEAAPGAVKILTFNAARKRIMTEGTGQYTGEFAEMQGRCFSLQGDYQGSYRLYINSNVFTNTNEWTYYCRPSGNGVLMNASYDGARGAFSGTFNETGLVDGKFRREKDGAETPLRNYRIW